MIGVFVTIFPVFFLMAIGYAAGRLNYIGVSVSNALNTYALRLGAPTLLFFGMYRLDLASALNIPMLVGFYCGAFACFVIAITLSRKIWNRRPGEAVSVGFSSYFSNTLLLGLPIATLSFGDGAENFVFGIIALHATILYVVGMFTMEFSRQDGISFVDTVKAALSSVFSNALMFGILLGIAANLTQFELPQIIITPLKMIGATTIPVALVSIGLSFNQYKISDEISETLMVSVLALCLHPTVTFLVAHLGFGLTGLPLQVAIVLASMPPGVNIYFFANIYNRAVSLSASVLIVANLLGLLTIPIWITLAHTLD